jgi:hypothetical protein
MTVRNLAGMINLTVLLQQMIVRLESEPPKYIHNSSLIPGEQYLLNLKRLLLWKESTPLSEVFNSQVFW